jgi:hypothetical protein
MNGYFAAGRISEEEKTDILKLHNSIYNGYRTMQPEVKKEQPLYVYDPAQDKVGAVMSNKGVVKPYTNVGINESTEQKEVCDECGSMMMEGECSECGWKGEVGDMDEQWQAAIAPALERMAAGYVADKAIDKVSDMFSANEGEDEDSDSPKSHRKGGKFKRHHYTEAEVSEYETGHLDDIYDESDLNPNSEFDYVKGASNKTNAFHVKEQAEDYMDNFEDPDNEDDGFEDINSSEVTDEVEEQGYTGGGNAPDMDLSNIDPAYDFVSDGPMAGGDVYPTEGEMDEEECDECWEKMESAWSEEIDEIDVSGVQGIYGAMEPAFDFDSEGPGKAGPYQHSQYESENGETEEQYLPKHVWDDAHKKGHVKTHKELGIDFDEDELEVDFDEFDPRDKSWEEITAYTGDDEFGGVDEDIKESLILQKNRIMEMMNRMKVIK